MPTSGAIIADVKLTDDAFSSSATSVTTTMPRKMPRSRNALDRRL